MTPAPDGAGIAQLMVIMASFVIVVAKIALESSDDTRSLAILMGSGEAGRS